MKSELEIVKARLAKVEEKLRNAGLSTDPEYSLLEALHDPDSVQRNDIVFKRLLISKDTDTYLIKPDESNAKYLIAKLNKRNCDIIYDMSINIVELPKELKEKLHE